MNNRYEVKMVVICEIEARDRVEADCIAQRNAGKLAGLELMKHPFGGKEVYVQSLVKIESHKVQS